eukprot:CAMPEP_0113301750 /NCGR_PEP_ID=MMETSP0010_2-20120614/2846_1 /TAXON_ID=216773 ORGANISM="Corethron hystrix, Strain 308" /NCGR_SAMPLE_ID=MMETSP0010_2 /ASSEMBLY_ACC=CAM_ASM_000155 /LENGTH=388 /DNA_ID=CAMNT_0000155419 /DNA_START=50 /DNA_END=1216 /DNA_ORIENTATION=- /assembly_acc=CAM_ASM_000155
MTAPSTNTTIFESEPLPLRSSSSKICNVPTPPSLSTSKDASDVNGSIDVSSLDPTVAFEVFAGKTFDFPDSRVRPKMKSDCKSSADRNELTETPSMRLARLSREISELEVDFAAPSASVCDDATSAVVSHELSRRSKNLADRLHRLGTIASVGPRSSVQATAVVEAAVTSAAASRMDADENNVGGVVTYELYGGCVSIDSNDIVPAGTVEFRLAALERAVGIGVGATSKQARSILERIEEMERVVAAADTVSLDAVATKAKVIRADLEAATRARCKLGSVLPSTDSGDSKQINTLHSALVALEDTIVHLPSIAERVRSLSVLHGTAAEFSSRLVEAEGTLAVGLRTVAEVEEALGMAGKQCVENAKAVEKNVIGLEERIKALMERDEN